MFGQEATETMWVTECVVNEYYQTRAESHGAIYTSKMYIRKTSSTMDMPNDDVDQPLYVVGMEFDGQAQSLCGKIMTTLLGWMMVAETKKALQQDLQDIKRVAEENAQAKPGSSSSKR